MMKTVRRLAAWKYTSVIGIGLLLTGVGFLGGSAHFLLAGLLITLGIFWLVAWWLLDTRRKRTRSARLAGVAVGIACCAGLLVWDRSLYLEDQLTRYRVASCPDTQERLEVIAANQQEMRFCFCSGTAVTALEWEVFPMLFY